jgi:hypothetical protein
MTVGFTQVLKAHAQDACGSKFDSGVTAKIGEGNLKVYVEARYQHTPTTGCPRA